jgi:hypothetical protein
MKDRTLKVGIRTDMQNKAGEEDRKRTGSGWSNVELTVDVLVDHIKHGHPFTHQFSGGRRKKENFLGADVLIADIDRGMRVEDALEDEFIKSHATFIYTTPSHTHDNHRFRIVFCLDRTLYDADSYEAMYTSLLKKIPTDPATRSCAQFFFGNVEAEIHLLGRSLDDKSINTMITIGMDENRRIVAPVKIPTLTPDTLVYVKSFGYQPLGTLKPETSIRCPLGTHQDKRPSAFVKVNREGVRGVECRACGQSAWSEPPKSQDSTFGYFDRMVLQYSNQSNSHFEYLGITRYDHGLETSMEKSNFHVFEREKLESLPLLPGVNLVKSPKGTGKTHALSKLVAALKDPVVRKIHGLEPDERVILVGHRQTLIRESAAKLGLDCYLDTGSFDTDLIFKDSRGTLKAVGTHKPRYYGICLDSLHSRVRTGKEKYGVLIIDESEQVFSHFLSEHMAHPTRNFEVLSSLMKQSKFTYCLDADLDTITMTGVMACLGWSKDEDRRKQLGSEKLSFKKLHCHLNTYRPPQREVSVYSSENHLLDELRSSLRSGQRCLVVSNKKKFIEGHFESFAQVYKDKKFKKIVSNSGNDEDIRSFLKNIKTDILEYDAVWASPSIGTGIDITFPNEEIKIDCVYGFFFTGITSHFDIDQQLGRVRHPGAVKAYVMPKPENFTTDRQRILQELLSKNVVKGLQYYLDHDGSHYAPGDHPFLALLTEVFSVRRRSMNKLRVNFIEHKESNGWKVNLVKADEMSRGRGSIVNKAGKTQQRVAWERWILDAEEITFKEFFQLKEKKDRNDPLTDAEKASWERYWIKSFYRQDVSEKLIIFDEQGRMRERISLLEVLVNQTLLFRSFKDWEENRGLISTYKARKIDEKKIAKAIFLREALSSAGVFDLDELKLRPDAAYGTNKMTSFVEFMQRHNDRLQRLFDKEINSDLEFAPVKQLGSLLRLVGLGQEVVVRNNGGKAGMASYKIATSSYQRLLEIMALRTQLEVHDVEIAE